MECSTAATLVANGKSVMLYVKTMMDHVIGGMNVNNEKFIENKLIAKEVSPEWQEVINAVKDKYKDTLIGDLIELRYEQKKSSTYICMKLHIASATFYQWRKEVINEIMLQAAYRQLFKP